MISGASGIVHHRPKQIVAGFDPLMTGTRAISGGVVHDLPDDFENALRVDPEALLAWEDITPLARNEWIC